MEVAYTIGGGGLHMKKYRTDNDGGDFVGGEPVLADEDNAASQGVRKATTTGCLNMVGLSMDAIADSTAAQVASGGGALSNGDNATHVTLCINPDAVFRARLNEGGTEGTSLVVCTMASANADGTDVSACDVSVPDNSTVWGYTGANAGQVRFTSTTDTFVVAMPYAIAANDTFLFAELGIGWEAGPTLTAALTEVDANTAGGQKTFTVVEFELYDETNDGRDNSNVLLVSYDHCFAGSHLA